MFALEYLDDREPITERILLCLLESFIMIHLAGVVGGTADSGVGSSTKLAILPDARRASSISCLSTPVKCDRVTPCLQWEQRVCVSHPIGTNQYTSKNPGGRGAVAEHLSIVKNAVYHQIESKSLPVHRVGRLRKFKLLQVDA